MSEDLKTKVKKYFSQYAKVEKVELEGPFVTLLVENPKEILDKPDLVVNAAKTLKKKIIILASKPLMDETAAAEFIRKTIPENAEIEDLKFVPETGEVYIVAKRTGYVVGKGGANIVEILKETGWRPIVMRAPTIRSTFLDIFYNAIISGAPERKKVMKRLSERIFRSPLNLNRGLYATFLGAAREVGRSSILITTDESTILLDCGISLSGKNVFPRFDLIDIDELDAVIITHAHLDHSGALPLLFKYGYRGPVYLTRPTRDLMMLLLYDYINLSQRVGSIPFFSWRDVVNMMNHTITLDYTETVDISPDIKLTFYNAGHILGSALAHLNIESARHNVLYTGDFRFRDTKLLDKAVRKFPRVETLVMECTYCGESDVLPSLSEAEEMLFSIIRGTAERGGKVLIPALAVGRAQEIMLSLVDGFERGILPDIPVYLDGMIYDSTAIHSAYPDYLSNYVRESVFKRDRDPFTEPHFNFISSDERPDVTKGGPAVIIAPSGMLTGGPSVDYLKLLAPSEENSIVLVSYQAEGTLGRKLRDGVRELRLQDEEGYITLKVKADVRVVEGFSAHADKVQLLSYLSTMEPRPHRVFLVHGEEEKMREFGPLASRSVSIRAISPQIGETFKLA
ncbi:MAG: beta-CASP ribonuclease aCPSF1 [Candidatus Korarchaeum sp.]|jgi:KH/beta-lactamase-domain protein|nr:beta-CASP ribonuclease aCPSF1 [Candidatus Korarchaeum sp.]